MQYKVIARFNNFKSAYSTFQASPVSIPRLTFAVCIIALGLNFLYKKYAKNKNEQNNIVSNGGISVKLITLNRDINPKTKEEAKMTELIDFSFSLISFTLKPEITKFAIKTTNEEDTVTPIISKKVKKCDAGCNNAANTPNTPHMIFDALNVILPDDTDIKEHDE